MSAIFGIYNLDGKPVARVDLERMGTTLAHRGPDGTDLWIEREIGLGHCMLWVTPESLKEHLPLESRSSHLFITADARLDNRNELMGLLPLRDHPSQEISDSELILAAYEKWGENCPEKLLGDFVFVIWDARKQSLFCARDHFGVKPFYYYLSEKAFALASEIKALLCVPGVPRRLNEVRVADFLASNYHDTEISYYEHILRLPPHHSLTLSRNGARLRSYWSLDPSSELRLKSDSEYAEAFRQHFTEAVRCRVRSAFPVGSMLSGGLDSSSVACTARKLLVEKGKGPLLAFSAIFNEVPECDETQFINSVLQLNDIEPHYLKGDRVSPLADHDRMVWHLDEVCEGGNLFIPWGLYALANQRGARVMLDGFDGDTTVSHGIKYLSELARNREWFSLAQQLPGYSRNFKISLWSLIWRYARIGAINPLIASSASLSFGRRGYRGVKRRMLGSLNKSKPPMSPSDILNHDFGRMVNYPQRQEFGDRSSTGQRTEKAHHHYRLTWGLMPSILESIDKAAAAFSIEPRFPFWDKRLVEFCLSLPAEQKIHRGWTRMIMRKGLDGILPAEIQWRGGKCDLEPNIRRSLRLFESERLRELVTTKSSAVEKYVNMATVREAYGRLMTDETTVSDVSHLWKALSLSLWLQRTGLTL